MWKERRRKGGGGGGGGGNEFVHISFEKLFEFLHTLFHNFSLSSSTECEICKSILSSLNLEHTFFNRL